MAGVGFSSHFCGGEYRSTEVFSFSKQACCCGDAEEDGCCSDQIKIVKLEKDQLGNSNRVEVKQLSQIGIVSRELYNAISPLNSNFVVRINQFYSPPLILKNLPILYCTYLI